MCCRVTKEGAELLHWEQDLLGLELVVSIPWCWCWSSYNCYITVQEGELIAQYIGQFLVLSKSETDLLFHQMFFENHERLIVLGPVMQPIVYEQHASAVNFQKVSQHL